MGCERFSRLIDHILQKRVVSKEDNETALSAPFLSNTQKVSVKRWRTGRVEECVNAFLAEWNVFFFNVQVVGTLLYSIPFNHFHWVTFCFSFKGIITSGGGCMVGERLSSSGTRLNVTSSSPVQSTGAIGGVKSSAESVHRGLKSVSRQSLLGKRDRAGSEFIPLNHISLLRQLTQIQLVIPLAGVGIASAMLSTINRLAYGKASTSIKTSYLNPWLTTLY